MSRARVRTMLVLAWAVVLVVAQPTIGYADTEPNDTMATATPIAPNVELTGAQTSGDVDWYRFPAAADRTFVAEIIDDSRSGAHYSLTPFDGNGNELAEAGDECSIYRCGRTQFDTTAAGNHFVRVTTNNPQPGNYRIRVLPRYDQGLAHGSDGEPNDVQALAEPLSVGRSGALDRTLFHWGLIFGGLGGDHDTYRFTATAGLRYHATVVTDLSVEGTETDAMRFLLYSPTGDELGTSDYCNSTNETCTLDFTVTESGTHFLRVGTEFEYGWGPYRITLEPGPTEPGAFRTQAPVRVLDTRIGVGAPRAAVGPGREIVTQVADVAAGSASASAVVLNLAVTAPTRGGHLTVYPNGSARPTASNLNFAPSQTRANLVMAPVGPDGKVRIHNGSAGTVHVVADKAGSFLPGAASLPGAFMPLQPARLLDTRGAGSLPVAGGRDVEVPIAGVGGVPASGVSAVVLNVTATGASRTGHVTVYPTGVARPTASNLNFGPGAAVANLVVVPLGADGRIRVHNGSAAAVDLIADVAGYYLAGTPTRVGMFVPLTPARLLDTRTTSRPVAAHAARRTRVGGKAGVPTGASAIVMNLTATAPQRGGYLTVDAAAAFARSRGSNVNFARGETVPNLVTSLLGLDDQLDVVNNSDGSVHLVADVAGYYLADDG